MGDRLDLNTAGYHRAGANCEFWFACPKGFSPTEQLSSGSASWQCLAEDIIIPASIHGARRWHIFSQQFVCSPQSDRFSSNSQHEIYATWILLTSSEYCRIFERKLDYKEETNVLLVWPRPLLLHMKWSDLGSKFTTLSTLTPGPGLIFPYWELQPPHD